MRYTKCNLIVIILFLAITLRGEHFEDSLRVLLSKTNTAQSKSRIYKSLSDFFTFKDFNKALKYSDSAIYYAKTVNENDILGEAYITKASAFSFKSNADSAIFYSEKALQCFAKTGNNKAKSRALVIIGENYGSSSNFEKAVEYYSKSAEMAISAKSKKDVAVAYNKMAELYTRTSQYKEALNYGFKALSFCKEIKDEYELAKGYNILGVTYDYSGKPDSAEYFYRKALEINHRLGMTYDEAIIMMNLGVIYLINNDLIASEKITLEALSLMLKLDEMGSVAACYVNLGEIYSNQGEYLKSINYLDKGIEILKQLKRYDFLQEAYRIKAEACKAGKNFELALTTFQLYTSLKDSLFSVEANKNLIETQTKFKTKEQEVELKLHQAEASRQKNIFYFMLGLVLLVVIIAVVSIRAYRNKQKANIVIEQQKQTVEHQKEILEEKQKEILDSINYAKRIQYTLLAHESFLKEHLQNHFVYFNPKDIVSGDFYWATKHNGKFYLAVCDSTGHGVPGAFMSLLNIGFLSEAINEKHIEKPNEIFDYVRQRLTNSVSKEGQKDGFDGILICLDEQNNVLTYAAANNAPILIQSNNLVQLESDRMPVGVGERKESFRLYSIDINPGDVLYLYTDGYADQFGGEKGKKFKYKQLNEFLFEISSNNVDKQHELLKEKFSKWKGELEQVDDVLIAGIKF